MYTTHSARFALVSVVIVRTLCIMPIAYPVSSVLDATARAITRCSIKRNNMYTTAVKAEMIRMAEMTSETWESSAISETPLQVWLELGMG